jgi:membrane fusion protein, heavy metal efflux system
MNRVLALSATLCVACALLAGCGRDLTAQEEAANYSGPVPGTVVRDFDPTSFDVDHPEQFPLATATEHMTAAELNVTGTVNPDVSRQIPVPSLATGRVIEIDARLGDEVKAGQLLFKVRSTDIAGAYSDYRKAVMNEQLTKIQLDRTKLLFEHGASTKANLEVAQNAEDSAKVDLETTREHLTLLGADPDHPSGIVEIPAPVSGVITDQQITNQSGVQALSAPTPFTISDTSQLWIVCDVYENDLAGVRMGDNADIHLNAFPDRVFKGRVSNIGAILDPNIRTARVRVEVANPGIMRIGMFASVTFRAQRDEMHVLVPTSSILHIHDRNFVYVPAAKSKFQRVEVVSGDLSAGDMQDLKSGIKPGQQVVANALVLDHVISQ